MLRRTLLLGLMGAVALPVLGHAQTRTPAPTEIVVQYPSPQNFKEVMEWTVEEFQRRNPDIRITLRAPYRYYDEGLQTLLREAVTRQMPDVSFQALNRLGILAERRIIVDLGTLIQDPAEFEAAGWTTPIRSLGQVDGKQWGLAFAASTPITYYNADLVRRAGGDPDRFPRDWDGVLALAQKIGALEPEIVGMHFRFQEDDWMFQGLVYAQGGEMMAADGRTVAFDGAQGQAAVRLLRRFVTEGGQPPAMNPNQAFQSFYAGQLGIQFHSTARLGNMLRGVGGRFEMRTAAFPGVVEGGRLPTGGMAGVITTQDPAKAQAAWRFLTFATGPEAAAMVVRRIGYLPTNQLAVSDPRHLGDFYDKNPLHQAAVKQIPLMRPWFAFPGANGLRITDMLIQQQQAIAEGRVTPEAGLATMVREAQALLPAPR